MSQEHEPSVYSQSIFNRPKRKLEQQAEHVDWRTKKKEIQEKKQKWDEKKSIAKLQKQLDTEKKTTDKLAQQLAEKQEKGREWTISIALPGSIMENAQSPELRTYLAGQIARAATVFSVDEIIVFDELKSLSKNEEGEIVSVSTQKRWNGCIQMVKILQYLECPQYLRKEFFPQQADLNYAGLLNPLDAPHHLRADAWNQYREGVVRNKSTKEGQGSYVDIGLGQKECQIDRNLQAGLRVTVKIDEESKAMKKKYKGKVVSPQEPRMQAGQYWGYRVRLVTCLSDVWNQCPYKEGYDVMVGTSERGSAVDTVALPKFQHILIVFGGVKGLEAAVEADDSLSVEDPMDLFQYYLNTCPGQGSGTIRTEEAVIITLSALRPKIATAQKKS